MVRILLWTSCTVMAVLALANRAKCFTPPIRPKQMEFFAPEGQYFLRVSPRRTMPFGNCIGALYRVSGEDEELVWSRHLINNTAPCSAVVSDDGDYVVTMDEWHHMGTFPIVSYGRNGKLLEVHSLNSLDVGLVGSVGRAGVPWREGATIFFGPDQETLFFRLKNKKTLMIDLRTGALMDHYWFIIHKGWRMSEDRWNDLLKFGRDYSGNSAVDARAIRREGRTD